MSHVKLYDEEDVRGKLYLREKLHDSYVGYQYDFQTGDSQEIKAFVKLLNRDDIHIKLECVESFYYDKSFKAWAVVFNKKEYLVDKTDEENFLEWKKGVSAMK